MPPVIDRRLFCWHRRLSGNPGGAAGCSISGMLPGRQPPYVGPAGAGRPTGPAADACAPAPGRELWRAGSYAGQPPNRAPAHDGGDDLGDADEERDQSAEQPRSVDGGAVVPDEREADQQRQADERDLDAFAQMGWA